MPVTFPVAVWVEGKLAGLTEIQERVRKAGWTLDVFSTYQEAQKRIKMRTPNADLCLLDQDVVSQSALRELRLMAPDLALAVIVTETPVSQEVAKVAHAAGQFLAPLLEAEKLDGALLRATLESQLGHVVRYDRQQRLLSDNVAQEYEALETGRPGTAAAWRFEEELIASMVQCLAAARQRGIKVLDIGCGTGRCTKTVLTAVDREGESKVFVVGIDFSPGMLGEAERQLGPFIDAKRCDLLRRCAENLGNLEHTFDAVLMPFGLPCYTPIEEVLREAYRVLGASGLLYASIYNHDALAYSRWQKSKPGRDEPERPISTWIDRDDGVLWLPVGGEIRTIRARTYTCEEFTRYLRRAGFPHVQYVTFPVLHSVETCEDLRRHAQASAKPSGIGKSVISDEVYQIDVNLSQYLRDAGFYGMFFAAKSESAFDGLALKSSGRGIRFHEPALEMERKS